MRPPMWQRPGVRGESDGKGKKTCVVADSSQPDGSFVDQLGYGRRIPLTHAAGKQIEPDEHGHDFGQHAKDHAPHPAAGEEQAGDDDPPVCGQAVYGQGPGQEQGGQSSRKDQVQHGDQALLHSRPDAPADASFDHPAHIPSVHGTCHTYHGQPCRGAGRPAACGREQGKQKAYVERGADAPHMEITGAGRSNEHRNELVGHPDDNLREPAEASQYEVEGQPVPKQPRPPEGF